MDVAVGGEPVEGAPHSEELWPLFFLCSGLPSYLTHNHMHGLLKIVRGSRGGDEPY